MGAGDSELDVYLQELGRYPLLKQEEERELAKRLAKGDTEARDRMVRSNLRLVVAIAKHYAHRGLALLDLIEEGNLGLLKAVVRFSPDHGCKFSTYASWWIKQSIRRALLNKVKSVRVPAYMVDLVMQWRRTAAELANKLGREPSIEEVRKAMGLARRKFLAVQHALAISAAGARRDRTDTEDTEQSLAFIPDPETESLPPEVDKEEMKQAIEHMLTERERRILEMRFGMAEENPMTLEVIGERVGLTRERVRQIEIEALRKLYFFLEEKEEAEEEERRKRQAARAQAERALLPRRRFEPAAPAPVEAAEKPGKAVKERKRRVRRAKPASSPPVQIKFRAPQE